MLNFEQWKEKYVGTAQVPTDKIRGELEKFHGLDVDKEIERIIELQYRDYMSTYITHKAQHTCDLVQTAHVTAGDSTNYFKEK